MQAGAQHSGGWGPLGRLAEELLDVPLDVAGEEPPAVALEWNSIRPDEELLKVPGHVVPAHRAPEDEFGVVHQGAGFVAGVRQLPLQEHKQGVGIFPVHIHFLQELKLRLKAISRTDVLQGQENFLVLAVLLNGLVRNGVVMLQFGKQEVPGDTEKCP